MHDRIYRIINECFETRLILQDLAFTDVSYKTVACGIVSIFENKQNMLSKLGMREEVFDSFENTPLTDTTLPLLTNVAKFNDIKINVSTFKMYKTQSVVRNCVELEENRWAVVTSQHGLL